MIIKNSWKKSCQILVAKQLFFQLFLNIQISQTTFFSTVFEGLLIICVMIRFAQIELNLQKRLVLNTSRNDQRREPGHVSISFEEAFNTQGDFEDLAHNCPRSIWQTTCPEFTSLLPGIHFPPEFTCLCELRHGAYATKRVRREPEHVSISFEETFNTQGETEWTNGFCTIEINWILKNNCF